MTQIVGAFVATLAGAARIRFRKNFSCPQFYISRLKGGVKLGGMIYPPDHINVSSMRRIIVVPSTWKLSREWYRRDSEIVLPEPSDPPVQTRVEALQPYLWRIKLAWSQELLYQTFFLANLSRLGQRAFARKNVFFLLYHTAVNRVHNNSRIIFRLK